MQEYKVSLNRVELFHIVDILNAAKDKFQEEIELYKKYESDEVLRKINMQKCSELTQDCVSLKEKIENIINSKRPKAISSDLRKANETMNRRKTNLEKAIEEVEFYQERPLK